MDWCTFEYNGTAMLIDNSSFTITNTEVYSSWGEVLAGLPNTVIANGIVAKNCPDVRISSTTFAEFLGTAIIADRNVTVNNCYFYSSVGLQILNTEGNMIITSNTFALTGGGTIYGCLQITGNNTIISNNTFKVTNSLLRPNTERVISILQSKDNKPPKFINISNNSFQISELDMAITDSNFFANQAIKSIITGNTFSNSANNKVYLKGDPSNIIVNNIFGL